MVCIVINVLILFDWPKGSY